MLSTTLSAPPPHPPPDSSSGLSPTTRRRGLSYLRSLSSRDHSTNNSGEASPSTPRPSPRHFFTRSTSYQDTKNSRASEGRRRSQSHSRPYEATSVSLARIASERGADSTQQPETAVTTTTAPARISADANADASAERDDMTHSGPGSNRRQATDGHLNTTPMARSVSGNAANGETESKTGLPTIRFFPHQDHSRLGRQSLNFSPISRTLPSEGSIIRVGRYSEREGPPVSNPTGPSDAPVGFKSKVVSRKHCEFSFVDGQWQIRDVASSSGTFLNHIRLSQPNQESRLYPVKDGDIIQLGIDFRGGEEMIFRCVKIRIECNRSWQKKPNQFNKTRRAQLLGLSKDQPASGNSGECSICLGNVLPCQALFVAPCAHVWHYKCIRPMLEGRNSQYPSFQCPNCRAYSDLEADVDVDMEEWAEDEEAADQNKDHEIDQTAQPDRKDHLDPGDYETPQPSPRRSEEAPPSNGAGAPDGNDTSLHDNHLTPTTANGTGAGVEEDDHLHNDPPSITAPEPWNSSALLARRHDKTMTAPPAGSGGLSPPVDNIPIPTRPTEADIHDILSQQRSQIESPNDDQITAGEGPLTPRNNAGPFVFDGSGSRTGSRRQLAVPDPRSLNDLRDGVD